MDDRFDQNEQLELHQFEWFSPSPPKPVLVLTVSSEGDICLNGKLCELVPKQFRLGINPDGRILGLTKCSENGYRVPKNGKVKDKSKVIIKALEKRGISLPARYIVENEKELWIAKIVSPTPRTSIGNTPKKPRQNGLKAMLPNKV